MITIKEAYDLLRLGKLNSRELVTKLYSLILENDHYTNSFIYTSYEMAMEHALKADKELEAGFDRGFLHGIPFGLKDIFDIKGQRTTCHSFLYQDEIAEKDSCLTTILSQAGAVFLGKQATYELALGGPSIDLPFPPARNPWDLSRQTGGSSSGSAVAVAAGYTPVSFGTDTTGSIRGPAALCGVVGMKPTIGSISLKGCLPLSDTLDTIGPFTWTVEDNAIALEVVSGLCDRGKRGNFRSYLNRNISGMKIGIVRNLTTDSDDVLDEIVDRNYQVLKYLERLGAIIYDVELPDYDIFDACGRLIMAAEGYDFHRKRLRDFPRKFGGFTFQRLMAGSLISDQDYLKALNLRKYLATEVNNLFKMQSFDALLAINNFQTAPLFPSECESESPPNVVKTVAFAVSGHPTLAVPCGNSSDNLPIGVQVVSGYQQESKCYQIGSKIESEFGQRQNRPCLYDYRKSTYSER